jgi:hypothetical protein
MKIKIEINAAELEAVRYAIHPRAGYHPLNKVHVKIVQAAMEQSNAPNAFAEMIKGGF